MSGDVRNPASATAGNALFRAERSGRSRVVRRAAARRAGALVVRLRHCPELESSFTLDMSA